MGCKKLCTLLAVASFVALAMPVGAVEIKFSGQVKNRGTVRDTSWWDKGSNWSSTLGAAYGMPAGVNSTFWGSNFESFSLQRLNFQQNNPLGAQQPYNDHIIAGQNNAGGKNRGSASVGRNTGNSGSAGWWDTRAMLGMQAVVSENLKGVFLVQFGQYDWGSYATQVGSNNEPFFVNNAYIDFKIPTTPIQAVVGIAPKKIGHGVLLQDDVAILNLAADFDNFMIQAFAIKSQENFRKSDDDDDIYGISIDFNLGDTGTFGVYGMSRRRNSSGSRMLTSNGGALVANVGDVNLAYLGVTGDLKFGNVALSVEGIWESGKVGKPAGAGDDYDITAFLGYADLSLNLDVAKVGIAGLYASGNKSDYASALGAGDDMEAFFGISPTDSYDRCVLNWDELFVREILANNVTNLMSPKWYVTVNPTDTVSLTLQNQWYWKDETVPGSGDYRGNFIGKNIDVIANIRVYDQLTWRATCSYMWTADANFGPADGIWQLRQALTLTF